MSVSLLRSGQGHGVDCGDRGGAAFSRQKRQIAATMPTHYSYPPEPSMKTEDNSGICTESCDGIHMASHSTMQMNTSQWRDTLDPVDV